MGKTWKDQDKWEKKQKHVGKPSDTKPPKIKPHEIVFEDDDLFDDLEFNDDEL